MHIRVTPEARPPICHPTPSTIALELDAGVFSSCAVLRACYAFADRAHAFVTRSNESGNLVVVLRPKVDIDLEALAGAFSNDVIDQQLRVTMLAETGAIRELIVAHALAEGNLLSDPDDYDVDPLGVAG